MEWRSLRDHARFSKSVTLKVNGVQKSGLSEAELRGELKKHGRSETEINSVIEQARGMRLKFSTRCSLAGCSARAHSSGS